MSHDNNYLMCLINEITENTQSLIQSELAVDAELEGFDSVDDYLHTHSSIVIN